MKSLLSCILLCCLFSVSFSAKTQKGLDILQQLEDDWRTKDEIRVAMQDLWYNSDEYLWSWKSSIKVINANPIIENTNKKQWWDVIDQLKQDWRTEEEIRQAMEDLGLNSNNYFTTNNLSYDKTTSQTKYISRSCKPYNIEYISPLNAYSSPDLNKKEYFVNIDYLKRYVDSKNAQNAECYTSRSWITTSYEDTNNSTDRYIAPNWKIYFITQQDWKYTSYELNSLKYFSTIDELKKYIKNRNPLISMWTTTQTQNTITNYTYPQSEESYQISGSGDDSVISDLRKELWIELTYN